MRTSVKKVLRACAPRGVRNWLRSPGASARWLWNEARYFGGAREVVEMRPGWSLQSHPSAYALAYRAQERDPEQVAEFDAFINACRPGMVLFDVGAHFGLFSLAALHYGGPDARAVAVDPSPTAARMLEIQGRFNGAGARLRVVRAAAGERAGWEPMVAAGVRGAGYFLPPQDHSGGELTPTPRVTLERLAEELRLVPTHVKIDVEGYEASVLRGARALLDGDDAPLVFIELHHELVRARGGDPAEALGLLRDCGYGDLAIAGARASDADILAKPLVRVTAAKNGGRV
jgi:FkbM family methyltransferase